MRCAVVVPIYRNLLTEYEKISLRQCLKVLANRDVFFVSPYQLDFNNDISHLTDYGKIIRFRNRYFASIGGYNRLLKSREFYQTFVDFSHLLIYQLDCFVFNDELDYWMGQKYDFIGSPAFSELDPARSKKDFLNYFNGGLSLRKVESHLNVLRAFRRFKPQSNYKRGNRPLIVKALKWMRDLLFNFSSYPLQPVINEDYYWSKMVPEIFEDFIVPNFKVSLAFSIETNPRLLFEENNYKIPFGCHAWWKYDLAFWQNHIEKDGYSFRES